MQSRREKEALFRSRAAGAGAVPALASTTQGVHLAPGGVRGAATAATELAEDSARAARRPAADPELAGPGWRAARAAVPLAAAPGAAGGGAQGLAHVQGSLQGASGRAPHLLLLVREVRWGGGERDATTVRFRDEGGEMGGAVHEDVLEALPDLLQPGAALELRDVAVLALGPRALYLGVCLRNVLRIWAPDGRCVRAPAPPTPPPGPPAATGGLLGSGGGGGLVGLGTATATAVAGGKRAAASDALHPPGPKRPALPAAAGAAAAVGVGPELPAAAVEGGGGLLDGAELAFLLDGFRADEDDEYFP